MLCIQWYIANRAAAEVCTMCLLIAAIKHLYAAYTKCTHSYACTYVATAAIHLQSVCSQAYAAHLWSAIGCIGAQTLACMHVHALALPFILQAKP
jgi:hypothetical protein